MSPKKSDEFYSDEELRKIKEQWFEDKARIDANPAFSYYFDREAQYECHLSNANLRILFRHAARLRRQLIEGEELFLYPREAQVVSKVYGTIIQNGYYSRSKQEEKKTRAWLGKVVSRQSYHRLKK